MISPLPSHLATTATHATARPPSAAHDELPQAVDAEEVGGPKIDEASISMRGMEEILRERSQEQEEHESSAEGPRTEQLSEQEQAQVRELRTRDREVRAHEQAHKAAAGDLASGAPRYETETGPDGRPYAVGGEVSIQLREGRTPEETVSIARRAQRAAMAPAEPSAQDRSVAAQASQMAAQAQAEVAETRHEEQGGDAPRIEEAAPVSQIDAAALSLLQQREDAYRAVAHP